MIPTTYLVWISWTAILIDPYSFSKLLLEIMNIKVCICRHETVRTRVLSMLLHTCAESLDSDHTGMWRRSRQIPHRRRNVRQLCMHGRSRHSDKAGLPLGSCTGRQTEAFLQTGEPVHGLSLRLRWSWPGPGPPSGSGRWSTRSVIRASAMGCGCHLRTRIQTQALTQKVLVLCRASTGGHI